MQEQRLRVRTGGLLLTVLAFSAMFLAGCRKKPPTSAEIHGVTQELVAAAQDVIGHRSEITIRPELQPALGARGGARAAVAADAIYMTLDDPRRESALMQSLAGVARKHDLTRGPLSSNAGVIQFDLFRGARRTHTIHIFEPTTAGVSPSSKLPANAVRLAIIIDDFGEDIASAREFLKLPCPLTLSIIPDLPDSTEIAEETHRRGDQVLLHFPMEASEANAKAETVELRVGMKPQQAEDMLEAMLTSVPHAAGVNNHQGSRATSDAALMDSLMPALRRRGLFFVDSRTTAQTVAYIAAQRDGVPATFRSAQFLDDVETRDAILKQLDRAAADATRKGWAVTIGHPHPATIAALSEALPRLQSRGIHLVFVSEVVK